MFNNLLESRARASRNVGGQVLSAVLHSAGIAIAVVGTQQVVTAAPPPVVERIDFVAPPPPPPPPPLAVPRTAATPPPIPMGHQILIPPIDIPTTLPPIDLTRPITDERNYTGTGAPGGRHDGVVGAPPRPVTGEVTYFAMEVERPVVQIAGTGIPEYPDALRNAMIEGEVRAQFVVDTTGRAEMVTLTILRSPHALFSEAVRKALSRMRFKPAETGAHKVRQIVEMPFAFSIQR